jgi:hypothetical protein
MQNTELVFGEGGDENLVYCVNKDTWIIARPQESVKDYAGGAHAFRKVIARQSLR